MCNNCNNCLNSRVILSENGYKVICCLSDKKALECILSDYSKHYITYFNLFSDILEKNNYEL